MHLLSFVTFSYWRIHDRIAVHSLRFSLVGLVLLDTNSYPSGTLSVSVCMSATAESLKTHIAFPLEPNGSRAMADDGLAENAFYSRSRKRAIALIRHRPSPSISPPPATPPTAASLPALDRDGRCANGAVTLRENNSTTPRPRSPACSDTIRCFAVADTSSSISPATANCPCTRCWNARGPCASNVICPSSCRTSACALRRITPATRSHQTSSAYRNRYARDCRSSTHAYSTSC